MEDRWAAIFATSHALGWIVTFAQTGFLWWRIEKLRSEIRGMADRTDKKF
jgi:hypothetical protein